ncbi:MAG TPA: right-handed parallel beta-helix repeat-containing protein [Saprospiraceae bacterium]|nr:right-handed parallel beta-helix repeat-containing protein [Saprospiraceae bacterium]
MRQIILFLSITLLLSFCQKEKFTTDPADKLEFSTDTLRFDTVFTQVGSATRFFKIYNRHKESIRIGKIYLENGANSRFNLNIDGISGDAQENLEIAPNDSMYVFAEVTINPNDQNSPFVVTENVVFETNGNVQTVVLEAFGQNANYLPSRFGAGAVVGYGCNGGEWVWDDPKPYVIYGVVVIDSCTVRIPKGTRVYVHGGLGKFVDDEGVTQRYNDGFLAFVGQGKLIVEGTPEEPVIFESDRLEPEFEEEAGQWTGIWLQSGSTGHNIDHCIIRNSVIGLRADSAVSLTLRNTQIYNTASSGLIGIHANITAENCLFHSNTGFGIQLEYGGNYSFDYCTVGSYGVDGEALRMGNALCLDAGCETFVANKLSARFRNCILMGSRSDQITLFDRLEDPSQFEYKLTNCIVRVRDLIKDTAYPDFFDHCQPCINATSQDTIFLDVNKRDFHLDTLHSIANRYAVPIPGIVKDLDNKDRDAVTPDAGCYEIEF